MRIREWSKAMVLAAGLALGGTIGWAQSGEPEAPSRKVEPVAVMGEVVHPGTVPFRDGMTFRDAIDAAGGFTSRADAAAVSLRRIGAGIGTIDGAKALSGDVAQNIRLRPGDTLFVKRKPGSPRVADAPSASAKGVEGSGIDPATRIALVGCVKEPGTFIFEPAMVLDALEAAGGVTRDAEIRRIVIRRGYLIDPTTSKSFTYDLEKVKQSKAADVAIHPGDVIEVPKRGRNSFFGTVGGAFTQVGRMIGSIARPLLGVRGSNWPW